MSKRNLVWLAAIVVVGAVVWLLAGWLWGIITAIVVLVVSEFVERRRRASRRAARGASGSALRDTIDTRRKRR
jgi:hypothetical protein